MRIRSQTSRKMLRSFVWSIFAKNCSTAWAVVLICATLGWVYSFESSFDSSSATPSLNSLTPRPKPRINSGILRPPKSNRTTTRMRIIWLGPMIPRNTVFITTDFERLKYPFLLNWSLSIREQTAQRSFHFFGVREHGLFQGSVQWNSRHIHCT